MNERRISMFDFNKCHPIELSGLVRIGNEYDCGYIVSERQIQSTEIILSFGIRNDWTFEEDFSKRKDVKIYSYDYSTKYLPFMEQRFKMNYARIVYNLLRLKRSKVLQDIRYIREQKALYKKFKTFFDETNGHFFIPKFIGEYDDEINTSFGTIFRELGNVEDATIFLKMDIEGGEYLCLPQLMPYLDKINGMAIEFHGLAVADMKFDGILDELSNKFYVAHVHGCNCAKLIYNTNIPSVIEITFINKKLVHEKIVLSNKTYPVEGLDSPCDKNKQDYKLVFTN
jgi:hypothetical protein